MLRLIYWLWAVVAIAVLVHLLRDPSLQAWLRGQFQ